MGLHSSNDVLVVSVVVVGIYIVKKYISNYINSDSGVTVYGDMMD